KDGFIQQVDTPQKLYNAPVNMFVAGFIGAPQMNFLDATVAVENDKVSIDFAGKYKFTLPDSKVAGTSLKEYDGKTITVGIRPEDIKVVRLEEFSGYTTKATVEITELMGSETYLYLDCFNIKLTSKAAADTFIKADSDIDIAFDIKKMHFFDKETELAICH
ncbi:MAG: TOBE domain-containing protein, partial [Oscillospiraceae bacterium]